MHGGYVSVTFVCLLICMCPQSLSVFWIQEKLKTSPGGGLRSMSSF